MRYRSERPRVQLNRSKIWFDLICERLQVFLEKDGIANPIKTIIAGYMTSKSRRMAIKLMASMYAITAIRLITKTETQIAAIHTF